MKNLLTVIMILISATMKAQTSDTMLIKIPVIILYTDTTHFATGLKAGQLRSKTIIQADGWCLLSASKDTLNPEIKTFMWLNEKGLPLDKKYKVWNSCDRQQ